MPRLAPRRRELTAVLPLRFRGRFGRRCAASLATLSAAGRIARIAAVGSAVVVVGGECRRCGLRRRSGRRRLRRFWRIIIRCGFCRSRRGSAKSLTHGRHLSIRRPIIHRRKLHLLRAISRDLRLLTVDRTLEIRRRVGLGDFTAERRDVTAVQTDDGGAVVGHGEVRVVEAPAP